MDNNTNDIINTKKGRSKITSVILISFLALIFSAEAFLSLCSGNVVIFGINFVGGVAFQTFLLCFSKKPLTLLIPCVASFICFPDFLLSFICLCAMLVCTGLFSIILLRRTESFRFFIMCSLVYSVLAGATLTVLMVNTFGSLAVGLEALTSAFSSTLNSIASNVNEEVRFLFVELADSLVLMIPAAVCAMGVFAAWLTRGILSVSERIAGVKNSLFSRITHAPMGLAVVFILLALFGMLFSFASQSVYYAVTNVRTVLSIIFMGEGIREYISVFRSHNSAARKHMFVIIGVALVMFFPNLLVTVAAYYGAYCTVFKRIRFVKIVKK